MTKALLSRRGVEFDAIDISSTPGAREELRALGILSVPAVVVGERFMTGWNPTRLAELVGFDLTERRSSPSELIGSTRLILEAALRATRQVPEDRWETGIPGRPRPLRELVRHLFHVIDAAVDADVLGKFPAGQWLVEMDIPSMTGAERLARYGEAVRARFEAWYTAPGAQDEAAFARVIDADVGPRTLAQVLERTRLHAAQHLRQVYALLERFGVQPNAPLTDERLRSLGLEELPEEVF